MSEPHHPRAEASDLGTTPLLSDPSHASAEADDWLGYESLHPLTWLPVPKHPKPRQQPGLKAS